MNELVWRVLAVATTFILTTTKRMLIEGLPVCDLWGLRIDRGRIQRFICMRYAFPWMDMRASSLRASRIMGKDILHKLIRTVELRPGQEGLNCWAKYPEIWLMTQRPHLPSYRMSGVKWYTREKEMTQTMMNDLSIQLSFYLFDQ